MRKDDHCKRTHHRILAKIEEGDTPAGMFHAKHFAGHTLVFAEMLASFANRNAIRARSKGREEQCQKQGFVDVPAESTAKLCG
jgi:hypothetical protein